MSRTGHDYVLHESGLWFLAAVLCISAIAISSPIPSMLARVVRQAPLSNARFGIFLRSVGKGIPVKNLTVGIEQVRRSSAMFVQKVMRMDGIYPEGLATYSQSLNWNYERSHYVLGGNKTSWVMDTKTEASLGHFCWSFATIPHSEAVGALTGFVLPDLDYQPRTFRIGDGLSVKQSSLGGFFGSRRLSFHNSHLLFNGGSTGLSGVGRSFSSFGSDSSLARLVPNSTESKNQSYGLSDSNVDEPPFGFYAFLFAGCFLVAIVGAFLLIFGYNSQYRFQSLFFGGLLFILAICGLFSVETTLFFNDPFVWMPSGLRGRHNGQSESYPNQNRRFHSERTLPLYTLSEKIAELVTGVYECS